MLLNPRIVECKIVEQKVVEFKVRKKCGGGVLKKIGGLGVKRLKLYIFFLKPLGDGGGEGYKKNA